MNWTKAKAYIPWVLAALGVVWLNYSCWAMGRGDEKNRAMAAALASAKDTLKAKDSTIGMLDSMLGVRQARVDAIRIVSKAHVAKADTSKGKADSLVVVAHLGGQDTVPACWEITLALDARTTECAELRKAVVLKDSAINLGQQTIIVTRDTLKDLRTSLKGALDKLSALGTPYSCKILFFSCLSRTASFFLGAGTTAGAFLLIRR